MILRLLIFSVLLIVASAAPLCAPDNAQIHLKPRRIAYVTSTVATVSSTSYIYTSTHTVTAPLVEVLISGSYTFTFTKYDNIPKESQGVTTTTSVASQESVSKYIPVAVSHQSGGFISSWSDTSLIPSGTGSPSQETGALSAPSSLNPSGPTTTLSSSSGPSNTAGSRSQSISPPNSSQDSPTEAPSPTSSGGGSSTSSSGSKSSHTFVFVSSTPSTTYEDAVSTVIPTALVYSPYNGDGTCKDFDTVNSDLTKIADKCIPSIRVYGTDCNYLSTVLPISKSLGLKVNQGFWFDSSDLDPIQESAAALVSYASSNGWDIFDYITIGNEAVNSGFMDASSLISIIDAVKTTLRNGGYTGYITTSEPPVTFEKHPELCEGDIIDFVGINPHSYFDASIDASQAGTFVVGQRSIVENICTGKSVQITETGYPSKGDTNGLNVPSTENQKIAIKSILDTVGSDVTILTMYNDMWKDPGSYGIEQYFGVYDFLN